jgi:DAK2 domain fusion protein YloV
MEFCKMQKSINGIMLRKMMLAGASLLEENKNYVDSLNVFPVPDGDTGTNMSLTMRSVAAEINECSDNSIEALSEAFAKGALKGARGNSGVILSQILRGMSNSLREKPLTEIGPKQFAAALNKGAETAYKAVTKPKEGTILTVVRMMAECATKLAKKKIDMDEMLKQVVDQGEETLRQTPELLPVLKKAGVVDSGGRGLVIVFTGFYKCLINDETLKINYEEFDKISGGNLDTNGFENNEAIINLENLGDIQFAYCTEFMVIQMKKKTTEADIDKLREKLMEIGDCVICVGDLSLVKVHVHTNQPNVALGYALELGELTKLKIENMLEQNRALKAKRAKQQVELKPYGIVSVVAGDGLSALFKDCGVDYCIKGGQTMNPSANDIAKAIENVPAKDVYVLPNNKNIVLAAEQSKSLVSNKTIHVIPTASIPEGISACLAFNSEATPEENDVQMMEAIKGVKSSSVTYAVRTTNIDGFDLKEGDIIGLNEKSILAKGEDVQQTVEKLIEKQMDEETVNITLFYGDGIKEDEANSLCEKLQQKYENCEVSVINGGQPVYYYLISMQ